MKKIFYRLFNRRNLFFFTFFLIFVFGFVVRVINLNNHGLVFGYDEVEDLIHVKKIAQNHDLVVIGKAIYGNPNIRHGVLSYYLMVPGFLLFHQNPVGVALWGGLFSLLTGVVVFYIAWSVFKNFHLSLIAFLLYVFSFLVIEYSGWVSHPTFAPFFVSLFFLGLWKIFERKGWGYVLSLASVGFSIQSNLLFIYLIPVFLVFLLIYRPKLPSLKTVIFSGIVITLSLSTIIYTEIKFNFSGVKTILNFSGSFSEGKISFFERLKLFNLKIFELLSNNSIPQKNYFDIAVGILIVLVVFLYFIKSKQDGRKRVFFLLFFLFSPVVTLFLGYHDKPWTFLGILPALSLLTAFVINKLKYKLLIIPIVVLIIFLNIKMVFVKEGKSSLFTTMPQSSFLSSQLNVVDYTYNASFGKNFSIDAVSYPLYVNTYWSYHYPWYGLKKYGYLPTWFGSNQLYPYDSLKESSGKEEFLYLIIDNTPDIPSWAKSEATRTSNAKSRLLEEKEIGGFIVQKRKLFLK